MPWYHDLADALLKMDDYVFFNSELNGEFRFEYQRDYTGLMARKPKRSKLKSKQGLFDIKVTTGTRHGNIVTHRNLLEDIVCHSSLETCLRVWRGEDPRVLGATLDEKETLVTMALLMFEQEVNFGGEEWQRFTNFVPRQRNPSKIRPRDMIMGFVRQAFNLGPANIKFWMRTRPGTACFSNPDDHNQSDYGSYPAEYKRYFEELETMGGTEALMTGNYRVLFRAKAAGCPDNPAYSV